MNKRRKELIKQLKKEIKNLDNLREEIRKKKKWKLELKRKTGYKD